MIDPMLRAVFEDIYANDRWTNGSGPGSAADNTIEYRAFIERFIRENDVRSVTDLGCGDWQFSRLIDWSGVDYIGYDIVSHIVDANRIRFQKDGIKFDVLADMNDLPGGDLLLCKEVLQHLPNDTVSEYLRIFRSRYRFAVITNAIEPRLDANKDIDAGDWRPMRVQEMPFHAPGAIVCIYHPQSGSHLWRNGIFLMPGDMVSPTPSDGTSL